MEAKQNLTLREQLICYSKERRERDPKYKQDFIASRKAKAVQEPPWPVTYPLPQGPHPCQLCGTTDGVRPNHKMRLMLCAACSEGNKEQLDGMMDAQQDRSK